MMRRGEIGRPYRPRINQPRRRFVLFRYDGDEITAGDLLLSSGALILIWTILVLVFTAGQGAQ
jgi:hypothetical protein